MHDGMHSGTVVGKVDAAALHPDFHVRHEGGYFRSCSDLRCKLKTLLAEHLAIEHDLFVLSNTTQGVVTALAGLASDGIRLRIGAGAFPPYAALPSGPYSGEIAEIPLLTHVDPLSGEVAILPSAGNLPSVLDAAQSFATVGHHRESLRADIFLCPLHKHAGVGVGLGLLAIRKDLKLAGLRAFAEVAEAGASSRTLLASAIECIRLHRGRIVNLLSLDQDRRNRTALEARGVDVLTPLHAGLPFVCVRGIDPAHATKVCHSVGLFAKFFRAQNVVRISGAVRGTLNSAPVDRSRLLHQVLLTLSEKRH